jgi:hypothetical protein
VRTHLEDLARDALELLRLIVALEEVGQLVVVHLGASGIVEEPVCSASDCGSTDVDTDGHVSEEEPRGDESFLESMF